MYKPILQALDECISGIKVGRNNSIVSFAAYADDVTVFLSSLVDAIKLQEILFIY
jgi:hypothetical protein